jgi:hypothetical protein
MKETLGERTALHSRFGQPRLKLITEEAATTTGGGSCPSALIASAEREAAGPRGERRPLGGEAGDGDSSSR